MSEDKTYTGTCFCGAVEIEAKGEPVAMGYCHCDSCKQWSASPVNTYTLWMPNAVKITKGEDNIGTYNKTEISYRKWCKTCGGHMMVDIPSMGLVDIFASIIPDLPFQPTRHVNYEETVMRIHDGLPKFKDFPKEAGGSGEELPE